MAAAAPTTRRELLAQHINAKNVQQEYNHLKPSLTFSRTAYVHNPFDAAGLQNLCDVVNTTLANVKPDKASKAIKSVVKLYVPQQHQSTIRAALDKLYTQAAAKFPEPATEPPTEQE